MSDPLEESHSDMAYVISRLFVHTSVSRGCFMIGCFYTLDIFVVCF